MSTVLLAAYGAYIGCLNRRAWDELPGLVHGDVEHNGRPFGVAGYRAMLERDVDEIPDLRFVVDLVVADASRVAARLSFDCRPRGTFMGLRIDGRRVRFAENVFYGYESGLIRTVWSAIDKAAIEAQLHAREGRRARRGAPAPPEP